MQTEAGEGGSPSGWAPKQSKPAGQIDPRVEESFYEGLGNTLVGFLVSVGLAVMVVATLWVQPSLEAAERLVGRDLWAVVVGCAVVSLGAHISFTRPYAHVAKGNFTVFGAVRELSFPVPDITEVGTRLGYAYVRLQDGRRVSILGLEDAPVRIDAELERFLRDFRAILPRPDPQLGPGSPAPITVKVRWMPWSRGLGVLLIVWVGIAVAAHVLVSAGG